MYLLPDCAIASKKKYRNMVKFKRSPAACVVPTRIPRLTKKRVRRLRHLLRKLEALEWPEEHPHPRGSRARKLCVVDWIAAKREPRLRWVLDRVGASACVDISSILHYRKLCTVGSAQDPQPESA